ncbi:hypothetical protein [Gallaecimonas sp. GXIMD1310]|uniref:hypothetical protein n=1 Tax=Gallaecimonas sp. GXIMD1310 TaxID=3131926 RepID=UPI00324D1518
MSLFKHILLPLLMLGIIVYLVVGISKVAGLSLPVALGILLVVLIPLVWWLRGKVRDDDH